MAAAPDPSFTEQCSCICTLLNRQPQVKEKPLQRMAPPRASPLLSHSARALRTQCGWHWMLGGDSWHGSACCLLLLGTCLLLVSQISCDRTCTGQEAFLQMPTSALWPEWLHPESRHSCRNASAPVRSGIPTAKACSLLVLFCKYWSEQSAVPAHQDLPRESLQVENGWSRLLQLGL